MLDSEEHFVILSSFVEKIWNALKNVNILKVRM